MKRLIFLLTTACLMVTPALIVGCEQMNDPSPEFQGGFAGGSGAFGESPESPGYGPSQRPRIASPAATQPVAGNPSVAGR